VPSLDPEYGGPAVAVPSLAKEMASIGWDSFFVSGRLPGQVSRNELMTDFCRQWYQGDIYKFPRVGRFTKDLSPLMASVVETHAIDVIHLHSIWNHCAWVSAEVARKKNIKLVISPRSELLQQSLQKSALKKVVARRLYADRLLKQAAGFHATDPQEAKAIRGFTEFAPILISPNGVDTAVGNVEATPAQAKELLGLNQNLRYILFLARLHRRKNPLMLLQAAIDGGAFKNGYGIIFAGPAEDLNLLTKLKALVAQNGLEENVFFPGVLGPHEKSLAFRASNLFVLPSEFENFGNSIAEALVCGLPVITTSSTPWQEIQDKGAGWIVEPDLTELTNIIRAATLIKTVQLQQMGARGQTVIRSFSWKRAAAEVAGFYNNVLAIS
jgi:glycosyltransferase involved in cell wall biosynthesis